MLVAPTVNKGKRMTYTTIRLEIYNSMKLEQSITSQHLKILRSTEIVITERDGKFIHYSVNYSKLTSVLKAVDTFLKD